MDRHKTPKKPVGQDWHKADIKAALEKAGWTVRKLASSLGVTHATLLCAFERRYPKSERRIAAAIGVHPMVIWPSRYSDDGQPNGKRGNPHWHPGYTLGKNGSTARRSGHVEKKSSN